MLIKKLKEFLHKCSADKKMTICSYTYGFINCRKYKMIGHRSYIYKPELISNKKYIEIGKHVAIYQDARIECITSWGGVQFSPEIKIGDNCRIGQGLHMTAGSRVIIEENVVISSYVWIGGVNHSYEDIDVHPFENKLICKDVFIGKNSLIGAGAKIMPGVFIGKNCVIGANSVVTKNIPDYSIAAGVPARVIKYYDKSVKKWVKI